MSVIEIRRHNGNVLLQKQLQCSDVKNFEFAVYCCTIIRSKIMNQCLLLFTWLFLHKSFLCKHFYWNQKTSESWTVRRNLKGWSLNKSSRWVHSKCTDYITGGRLFSYKRNLKVWVTQWNTINECNEIELTQPKASNANEPLMKVYNEYILTVRILLFAEHNSFLAGN